MRHINVDVRFYHVGVPQLKKKFIFITLTTLFSKKNIDKNEKISLKNIQALRPLVGIKSEKIFNIIDCVLSCSVI